LTEVKGQLDTSAAILDGTDLLGAWVDLGRGCQHDRTQTGQFVADH